MTEWQRKLYFGDNLDILREYVAEERRETPLYPPASGGKGIAAGRSVDGGRSGPPLCAPASGGKGISAGRSVDGGRSETPLCPPASGGKGQGSVRSLPACGEGRVGSRPVGGKKKGADKGVDGYIYFFDDDSGQAKKIVVQVKGGGVGSPQVSQLRGMMEREKAEIGAFITLREPTDPMKKEAAAGFYDPTGLLPPVPRLQILTIEGLLSGQKLQYPKVEVATFKKAPRQRKGQAAKQQSRIAAK